MAYSGMLQTLPGFREFYPEDCARRNYIFDTWRAAARRFSFEEFDGPVLEPLELLTAKSGPEIVSQLFNFTDKGGREVTLRPELTPTLARMVGAKAGSLRRPIRWFGIAENFRYEKPQKGRLRSHYQLNADILGESGVAADAEVISLLIHTLNSFGLFAEHFVLRLSDRNLWLALLEARSITGDATLPVLSIIDKLEREKPELIIEKLGHNGVTNPAGFLEEIKTLAAIRDLSELEAFFKNIGAEALVTERLAVWRKLLSLLKSLGVGDYLRVDLSIVRGLAYYTGFVFEAFQTVGKGRALAGGGRYDHLVEKLGGPDMPAVGFGMGDVTLGDLLADLNLTTATPQMLDAYVVIGGPEQRSTALTIVSELRQAGLCVDYPMRDTGFGKQFKQADQRGAYYAVVVGEEESGKGGVNLKNLKTGDEHFVLRSQLIAFIGGR